MVTGFFFSEIGVFSLDMLMMSYPHYTDCKIPYSCLVYYWKILKNDLFRRVTVPSLWECREWLGSNSHLGEHRIGIAKKNDIVARNIIYYIEHTWLRSSKSPKLWPASVGLGRGLPRLEGQQTPLELDIWPGATGDDPEVSQQTVIFLKCCGISTTIWMNAIKSYKIQGKSRLDSIYSIIFGASNVSYWKSSGLICFGRIKHHQISEVVLGNLGPSAVNSMPSLLGILSLVGPKD